MKSIKSSLSVALFVLAFVAVASVSYADDMMMKKDDAMMQKGDMMMKKGDALMEKGDAMMKKGDEMMKVDGMPMPVMEAASGYCPVCVMHGMLNKGSSNFTTEYKGKVYKFAGMDQQKMFLENPEEYTKDLDAKLLELMKK